MKEARRPGRPPKSTTVDREMSEEKAVASTTEDPAEIPSTSVRKSARTPKPKVFDDDVYVNIMDSPRRFVRKPRKSENALDPFDYDDDGVPLNGTNSDSGNSAGKDSEHKERPGASRGVKPSSPNKSPAAAKLLSLHRLPNRNVESPTTIRRIRPALLRDDEGAPKPEKKEDDDEELFPDTDEQEEIDVISVADQERRSEGLMRDVMRRPHHLDVEEIMDEEVDESGLTEEERQMLDLRPNKRFKCPDCTAAYRREAFLHKHRENIHGVPPPMDGSGGHEEIVIPMKKPRRSSWPAQRTYKPPVNNSKLRFECEMCLRRFMAYEGLALHQRQIHGTVTETARQQAKMRDTGVQCPVCDLFYRGNHALSEHVVSEHPDYERVLFECPECSVGFKHWARLRQHRRMIHHVAPKYNQGYIKRNPHLAYKVEAERTRRQVERNRMKRLYLRGEIDHLPPPGHRLSCPPEPPALPQERHRRPSRALVAGRHHPLQIHHVMKREALQEEVIEEYVDEEMLMDDEAMMDRDDDHIYGEHELGGYDLEEEVVDDDDDGDYPEFPPELERYA